MNSRRLRFLSMMLLAMGLVVVLFVSACGGGEVTTTTAGPATTGGSEEPTDGVEWGEDIVLGAINSMTGSNALTGEEQRWTLEKAVADINAAGGIKFTDGTQHKLVLRFADDKSDPASGAEAAEKLIKVDGFKIIIGSNITPINQAAAQVCEKYGVYYHVASSWIDDFFMGGMGLKWTTTMFERAELAGVVPVGAVQRMPEADQPKKWAILVENTPDGKALGDGVKAVAEAAGFNVVATETYIEGNKDFSSIILKFKEAGVEATAGIMAPTDGITYVKQCKENGWAPKMIFAYKGFWPVSFMETLGPDSDGLCWDGFWSEMFPYPYCAELGQAFKDTHGGNDSVSIGLYYAAMQVLAEAMNRAGSADPAAVRDQVFNGSFEGTTMGDVTYNEKGVCHIPFIGGQWVDGKRVIVYPENLATGVIQPIVPWDER